MTNLNTLLGPPGPGRRSRANDINDAGEVVGFSNTAPFLWSSSNGMREITGFSSTGAEAVSVNNPGQVLIRDVMGGWVWTPGGSSAFVSSGPAISINDLSQVVGGGLQVGGFGHAFIWTEMDGQLDLGTAKGNISEATDISRDGFFVVGASGHDTGATTVTLWAFRSPALGVSIDIVPNDERNRIRLTSNQIPVGILSTEGFNVPNGVMVPLLRFGRTGDEASLRRCRIRDSNKDGLDDLVCTFFTDLAAFRDGDEVGNLRGETVDGKPLVGSDRVSIR